MRKTAAECPNEASTLARALLAIIGPDGLFRQWHNRPRLDAAEPSSGELTIARATRS